MIENLQDEPDQLKKQAKGTKLHANIGWELEGEKWSKKFFKVLERENLENQTIPELYTDYILMLINQNILAILRAFGNLHKNLWKTLPRGDNFQSCYYWTC